MRNRSSGRFSIRFEYFQTLLCLLLLVSTFSFAQKVTYPGLTRHQKDSLKKEIKAMMAEDQKYRWMVMLGEMDSAKLAALRKMPEKDQWQRMKDVQMNRVGISELKRISLDDLQQYIDTTNMRKIIAIINNYGFPTYIQTLGGDNLFFAFTGIAG